MAETSTPTDVRRLLLKAYNKIAERTQKAQETKAIWPCQKGCDLCCRRLANPPEMSEAEWELLAEGITQLSPSLQTTIHQKVKALESRNRQEQPYVVCPLLDEQAGACRVYEHRPSACRMYGFYASRHNNQWCQDIEDLFQAGEFDEIVLGNFTTMKQQLHKNFGEDQSIQTWFQTIAP